MPEVSEYAPGTPSWVDLGSPDADGTARFYNGLFGWEARETGSAEETGGYRMLTLRGRNVAGLGPAQSAEQTPVWMTYVTTDDAAAATARVRAAGGEVVVEPLDVLEAGRVAAFLDPGGATIAVWEPRAHHGADLVNEPGALCWNELATRDVDAAKAFYAAVFRWEGVTTQYGETTYTEWRLDGRTVGGMIQMNDQWPAELPSHWMVYFAVEDTDAAAERARELGGTIGMPPSDTPAGRFAVLNDPQGAYFSIIALAVEAAEDATGEGA